MRLKNPLHIFWTASILWSPPQKTRMTAVMILTKILWMFATHKFSIIRMLSVTTQNSACKKVLN